MTLGTTGPFCNNHTTISAAMSVTVAQHSDRPHSLTKSMERVARGEGRCAKVWLPVGLRSPPNRRAVVARALGVWCVYKGGRRAGEKQQCGVRAAAQTSYLLSQSVNGQAVAHTDKGVIGLRHPVWRVALSVDLLPHPPQAVDVVVVQPKDGIPLNVGARRRDSGETQA